LGDIVGAFICSISDRDWETTLTKGIYGNRTGNIRGGFYKDFDPKTKYSIIRDLVGMKVEDVVFFHILGRDKPSSVHGIYSIRGDPFYDESRIWGDDFEVFPYRFLFSPHPKYRYLCDYDANIEVTDFYELIENRRIWSLATLENEVNIEARSVRKIGEDEANEIIRLLHRDYRQRRRQERVRFDLVQLPIDVIPLYNAIGDIGRYENSIKAFLMYKLAQGDPYLLNVFGGVTDFMNEVFIAQTTRKTIDILCINRVEGMSTYVICEVKTGKCDTKGLSQVLYYMDLFKQKDLVDINSDIIAGCLIGRAFDEHVIEYSRERNRQGVNGSLILLKYQPSVNGRKATFSQVAS